MIDEGAAVVEETAEAETENTANVNVKGEWLNVG